MSAFSACLLWSWCIIVCSAADAIRYEQLKGDALKTVLKPIPPKAPPEALRSLEVIEGFTVEFVAHEPLVLDPVAAAIDDDGRMYVAEDADYPYKPEPGEKPKGRIRLLKDKDGDGFYEESHLFAEGLLWPAGVAPWKGGVFATAPPDIWYLKDTNGDGRADVKEKVYTGFGTGGSQYVLNNLQWGLDHKLYASVAGNGGMVRRVDRPDQSPISVSRKDFRFDPVTRNFESISGGRQFGNTFDDFGNRFLCTQDTPVYHVLFPQHYLDRNPFLSIPETTRRIVPGGVPIYRTSPIEAWRAIRSSRRLLAEKGSPNQSGVSHHVLDGVAGVSVYRGGAFPAEFYGNVFVGDAQNNLVHRRSLVPDGVTFRSERLDQGAEFLRSNDNWFRPVNFVNAPDGTLFVLDLAREVLEAVHIPMDVVSHLELTSGRDRGRIYRVKPKGFQRAAQPRMSAFSTVQLVAALESPHSWSREAAHRLIYERQDPSAVSSLRQLLQRSTNAQARLHALWSLHGLNALSDHDIIAAFSDSAAPVREHAVRLIESRPTPSNELVTRLFDLLADPDARVRFQLAFTLGELPNSIAEKGLFAIVRRDAADELMRTAVLSSTSNTAATLLLKLLPDRRFQESPPGAELIEELARIVGARHHSEEVVSILAAALSNGTPEVKESVIIGLSRGFRISGGQFSSELRNLNLAAARQFHACMTSAIETIENKSSDAARLHQALELVENASPERAVPAIIALLDRFPPASIRVAAIRTLSKLNAPHVAEALIGRWKNTSPEVRREMLSSLLVKVDWTKALLDALARGQIKSGELDALARSSLRNHADAAIRKQAASLLGTETQGARTDVVQRYRGALELKGDGTAGQRMFDRLCSSCHRLNGVGNDLGPNLALASTRSRDELLTQIVDPNREVNPAFVQYTVTTNDGESVSGLMMADNAASVTIKGVNYQKQILRQQIQSLSSDGQSLMPVGLEQGVSMQEMADLLSFLVESQYDYGTSGQSFSRDVPERTP